MTEKFKKFADLYEAHVKSALEKTRAKLDQFIAAREKALTFSTPVNEVYATLKDLVAVMVGKDGKVNKALYKDFIEYGVAPDEEKNQIKLLKELAGAPAEYAILEAHQKNGAGFVFDSIIQELSKRLAASKSSFKQKFGTGSPNLEENKMFDFGNAALDIADRLKFHFLEEVVDSPEFYYAAVEKEAVIDKKEEPAVSPINAKPEVPTATSPSSAINEVEKQTVAPTGSALNPEKQAATTAIESSTVTSMPSEMPKEPESPSPAATPVTVNIETPPAATTAPAPVAPAASAPPTEVLTGASSATANTINQTSITTNTATSTSAGPSNTINQENIRVSQENSLFARYFGGMSPENQKKLMDIEKKSETATSSINEKNSKTSSTETSSVSTKTESSVVNTEASSKRMSSEKLAELKKYTGIDLNDTTKEKKEPVPQSGEKSSEPINESSKIEVPSSSVKTTSTAPGMPASKTETSVTKSTPTLPAPKQETSAQMKTAEPVPAEEKTAAEKSVSAEEVSAQPSAAVTPESAPAESYPEKKINIDLTGLEQRMARLEMILSGPLDVRIVD